MSAAMVRAGGIMALATIPMVLVMGALIGAGAFAAVFRPGAAETVWSPIALLYFVFLAFAAFVLWTTRGLFEALGYVAADGPVLMLIGLLVFAPPLALLPWTWFSILATGFGRQIGSRLWQAVGIVYLFAMALTGAGMVSAVFREYHLPNMDLAGAALAALLIGWNCHDIGLIVSARRIART